MINSLAGYILDKCTVSPALARGTNFFVGFAPDITAVHNQPIITILRQVDGQYEANPSQSVSTHIFRLQFLGDSYFTTERYAKSLTEQIRNVWGAQITDASDTDYVYHCGNLAVTAPVYMMQDSKGRHAFVASLSYLCQRILAVEGT